MNIIIGAVHLDILLRSVANGLKYLAENQLKLRIVPTEAVLVIASVLSTLVLLYITLTLGVLLPKKIAGRIPERWAYLCINPVCFVTKLLLPFTGLVTVTTNGILKIFGMSGKLNENDVTEEEIINMVNEGHEQGIIQASEAEMISNIFEFGDKEAQDIMTHRNNIVAIDAETSLKDAITFMLDGKNSRYPVYEENIDHIVGILHLKDALRFHGSVESRDIPLRELDGLMREPCFIPQTKNIDEIVGNIMDEYDVESEYIEEKGKDEYVIEGKTPLEELEEKFGITFENEEYETLNGFLISRMDRIPEPDDKFDVDYKGYNFKILTVENKMIQSVLVTKLPEEVKEDNDGQREESEGGEEKE